jgi:hypothetical protein
MATTIPEWKSVTPNRRDDVSLERAIKTLDRQNQIGTDAAIEDINTIITNVTNITNGTTTVYAKWSSYTGLVIPWAILALGLAQCLQV